MRTRSRAARDPSLRRSISAEPVLSVPVEIQQSDEAQPLPSPLPSQTGDPGAGPSSALFHAPRHTPLSTHATHAQTDTHGPLVSPTPIARPLVSPSSRSRSIPVSSLFQPQGPSSMQAHVSYHNPLREYAPMHTPVHTSMTGHYPMLPMSAAGTHMPMSPIMPASTMYPMHAAPPAVPQMPMGHDASAPAPQAQANSAPGEIHSNVHIRSTDQSSVTMHNHGARYSVPLPPKLVPDHKDQNWYLWEPSVKYFYEQIGFPGIMYAEHADRYTLKDHSLAIHYLLQVLPDADRNWFIMHRKQYVHEIWSFLQRDYGCKADAYLQSLVDQFEEERQSADESINDYVTRIQRLVYSIKAQNEPISNLQFINRLLKVRPVLADSNGAHQHFLSELRLQASSLTPTEVANKLIAHEDAIMRQVKESDSTPLMSVNTIQGAQHADYQRLGRQTLLPDDMERPPYEPGKPICAVCWNYTGTPLPTRHFVRDCPFQGTPWCDTVKNWLDRNPRHPGRAPDRRRTRGHNSRDNYRHDRPQARDQPSNSRDDSGIRGTEHSAVHNLRLSIPIHEPVPCDALMIDSGADCAVFSDPDFFVSLAPPERPHTVSFGKQATLPVAGVGSVVFQIAAAAESLELVRLHNVFYVPTAAKGMNIVSVHTLHQHGAGATFDTKPGYVRWPPASGSVLQSCVWQRGIPYVSVIKLQRSNMSSAPAIASVCCHIQSPPSDLLHAHTHARFGHVGATKLDFLVRQGTLDRNAVSDDASLCRHCITANATKDSYPSVDGVAKLPGDVLHTDILEFPERTLDGNKYVLTIVDEYTRFVHVSLMNTKSEAKHQLVLFLRRVQTLHNRSVKYIRCDNGKEFYNETTRIAKEQLGVSEQHVPNKCHQSNGLVERMNRTLAHMTRALLVSSHFPYQLWGEAMLCAVHIYNLLPHSHLVAHKFATPVPHVLFHNESADRLTRLYNQLVPFGVACLVHNVSDHASKLADRAYPGYIIGYGPSTYLYRVLHVDSSTKQCSFRLVRHLYVTSGMLRDYFERERPPFSISAPHSIHTSSVHAFFLSTGTAAASDFPDTLDTALACDLSVPVDDIPASAPIAGVSISNHTELNVQITADDPISESESFDPCECATLSPSTTHADVHNVHHQSQTPQTTSSAAQTRNDEPSVSVAMKGDDANEWRQAMVEELQAMFENAVYELVDRPPHTNVVGSRWVLKYKRNALGEVERRKARLVAQGFSQRRGVDYDAVWAPTGQHATLRSLLVIAARFDYEIQHVDIKCAFLNGDLEQEVYMHQPPLFSDGSNRVWRLKKCIYGLKQASRQWHAKLKSTLEGLHFTRAKHDPALFIRQQGPTKGILYLFVWVDDILVIGCRADVAAFVRCILTHFEGRDLGPVHWILGTQLTRDRSNKTIFLSQRQMIHALVEKHGMTCARVVNTPLDANQKIVPDPNTTGSRTKSKSTQSSSMGELLSETDTCKYMSIVGALQYIAVFTRPDISNATGRLARYMSTPTKYLLTCAERVLRYLKGTSDDGLLLDGSHSDTAVLQGYADADYAIEAKSTTGLITCLYGQCVHWRSKRQPVLGLSSTEAELVAMNQGATTLKWLKMLYTEDLCIDVGEVVLYGDNLSTLAIIQDPLATERTRHVDQKHKKIQEYVHDNILSVRWVCTNDQLADCMTKQLSVAAFMTAKMSLGIRKTEGAAEE